MSTLTSAIVPSLGVGPCPRKSSPSGYSSRFGSRFPAPSFSTCLRLLRRVIVSNKRHRLNRRVDMKLAQGVPAVKRAESRLHHVFRVLFAAKTPVRLPFDQVAKPGTILLVVGHVIPPPNGVLGDWRRGLLQILNSSAQGPKEGTGRSLLTRDE